MTDPAATELGRAILAAAESLLRAAARRDRRYAAGRVVAIGWATVDSGRAEREFSEALGVRLDVAPGARLRGLGARASSAHPFVDGPELLFLEPDREGRLAAFLARHGEGIAMIVVATGVGTRRVALTTDRGEPGPRAAAGRRPSVDD